ncbi:MAG: hypothetical protein Q4A69_00190 [Moraxella sp.]|nr:hypothetical protein [Moraxella sp.]
MREIIQANVIGKSQNRTALGMMAAYLHMYPQTTLSELNTRFSKAKVCPDTGIDKLFYTASEIEQEQSGNKGAWFTNGNACFTKAGEWLTLGNGQKVAFNKVWTASSLALLQKELAKSGIYADVNKSAKTNTVGYHIHYEYTEYSSPQGLPAWILIVAIFIILALVYLAYHVLNS